MTLVSEQTEPELVSPTNPSKQPTSLRTNRMGKFIFRSFVFVLKLLALACCILMLGTAFERLTTYLDPIVQYRFQLMGAILILGALLLVCKRPAWAFFCLLVAMPTVVGAASFLIPASHSVAASEDQASHRMLLFNIREGNRELELLIDLIEKENPDVICLVELNRWSARRLKYLEDEYEFTAIDPNYWGFGCRVLSKYPIEQQLDKEKSIRMDGVPIVRTNIQFPEQSVALLLSHPRSPISFARVQQRNDQLDDFAEFVKLETEPVICCGDFNCTTWSVHLQDFIRDTGLKDSRQGFGLNPSWPAFPIAFLGRITIDHVFASDEIIVQDRRVGPYVGSDHLPVIIDFKIAK